ncbi:MAG: DegV family protein [Candidatus Coproplasma sp.]
MIKIITDGASDFTVEEARELNIKVIPIKVYFDGEEFTPGVNLTDSQFYTKLKDSKKLPSTSLINEETYKEAIEEELNCGNQVFVLTLSSKLSGSFNALQRAVARLNSPDVAICDTLGVTITQNIIVREAVKLANAGATLKELKEQIEAIKGKAKLFAMIDDVSNLIKGGRLSMTAGLAATVLKIKPVVTLENGLLKSIGKPVGVRHAMNSVISYIGNIDRQRAMCLGHSDCLERLEIFAPAVEQKTGLKGLPVYNVGAVVGTHVGRGCVGIAYFER